MDGIPDILKVLNTFFFYNLELLTKKKFIHGQPVCLGFILGCILHNKYDNKFSDFFKNIQYDIRPESMNVNCVDVENTLKTLNNFVVKNKLWYGIANEFSYSKDILNKLIECIEDIYK